ncbi:hypothetical protein [Streptomyces sp. NPDC051561]|uniref:hypothetical protein n=1 Tax=Streptomyces sp. NPDC051561 TaxID=3365658 RepID=UPI0037B13EC2
MLTSFQRDVVGRFAAGDNAEAAARHLDVPVRAVYTATDRCAQRLGVSGRTALVHVGYLVGAVSRPPRRHPTPLAVRDVRILELLASGAGQAGAARHLGISRETLRVRLLYLQDVTSAASTWHLMTRGWQDRVIGTRHVFTISGRQYDPVRPLPDAPRCTWVRRPAPLLPSGRPVPVPPPWVPAFHWSAS